MIRAAVTVSPESKLWSPSVAKRAAPPMATIAASQMSSGCARASSHSRRKRTRRSSAAGMYPRRIRTSARRPPQRLSDDAVAQVRHLARARYLDRLEPRRRPRLAQQAHATAEENGQDEDQDLVEEPLARDRPGPAPAERLCRLRPLRAASDMVGCATTLAIVRDQITPVRQLTIGAAGFEPATSPTRTVRATRLRHAPTPLSPIRIGPAPRHRPAPWRATRP